jgi:hypothetical protein
MQLTEFSTWFETKALSNLKQSMQQFTQLMDEQIQLHYMENKTSSKEIPQEYLQFHIESCINSFKINLLSELQQACFSLKNSLLMSKTLLTNQ